MPEATVSPELNPMLLRIRAALVARPQPVRQLCVELEALLLFLSSPQGRTDINCRYADFFFSGDDQFYDDIELLPHPLMLILDDIGMGLHDTVRAPEVASNFESTPEQLLARLRALNLDALDDIASGSSGGES